MYHAHALEGCKYYLVHRHHASEASHIHSTSEYPQNLPVHEASSHSLHVHEAERSGLRLRHAHSHKADGEQGGKHHHHDGDAFFAEELVPQRPVGWRIFFPAWNLRHPCWHLWPLPQMRMSHAKAHFNSSGVDDMWPGALTLVTQGFKVILAVVAWFYGRDHSDSFYTYVMPPSISVVSCFLLACWVFIWPQGRCIVALTFVNYLLYIIGWTLSVLVVLKHTDERLGIPNYWALVPTLGPPLYITARTSLFFPFADRRRRFLLAALSNRSVPLELNLHVVGPRDTWKSHAFLTMLNSYAMVSTFASKVVVFTLKVPSVIVVIFHCLHLLSTVWASLYAIRCRQIAIDCYDVARSCAIPAGSVAPGVHASHNVPAACEIGHDHHHDH